MPGRTLLPESAFENSRYAHPVLARRRQILRETIAAFEGHPGRAHYALAAARNLRRWSTRKPPRRPPFELRVIPGDWGDVTGALTREFGETFAALNMANAYAPGGAYVEGAVAQEENMFRRTDCHFAIDAGHIDLRTEQYLPEMRSLLSAEDGRVYLDVESPRLCIRGSEDSSADDLGYPFLADDRVFAFYELRAAAQDLRGGLPFDVDNARARIEAQLDTLISSGVRHAVLGAFGCGAFLNPARTVARLYRESIEPRRQRLSVIAFAIHYAGYGPDNFTPFSEELV